MQKGFIRATCTQQEGLRVGNKSLGILNATSGTERGDRAQGRARGCEMAYAAPAPKDRCCPDQGAAISAIQKRHSGVPTTHLNGASHGGFHCNRHGVMGQTRATLAVGQASLATTPGSYHSLPSPISSYSESALQSFMVKTHGSLQASSIRRHRRRAVWPLHRAVLDQRHHAQATTAAGRCRGQAHL